MLTTKALAKKNENDERAEEIRGEVLSKIEVQVKRGVCDLRELTRLLEALQRSAPER